MSPQQGGWDEESEASRGLCLCCHQGEVEGLFTDLTETSPPRDVSFWDTFVLFALRAEHVSPPHWLEVLGARTQTLTPELQERAKFGNCLTPGSLSVPSPGTKVIAVPKSPSWSHAVFGSDVA